MRRILLLCVALGLVMGCSAVPQQLSQNDSFLCKTYNISCGGNDSQPPPASVTPDGSCQCVPYAQCPDIHGGNVIDIRTTAVGCKSYLEKCCRPEDINSSASPPTVRTSKCGTRNANGVGVRIIGNNSHEAQYAEFPWMVAVMRPDNTRADGQKYECGGSLIHPQVVLTAAHCVKGKSNLVVRAGEWDTQTEQEMFPVQDRNVREVIVHEQFNKGNLLYDAALLILDKPVDMSKMNVGLICLPEAKENMDNRDCVTSGWGKNSFGTEGIYQVILKRVDLPMVPWAKCQEALRKTKLGPRFVLHESFNCAGGIPGRDACMGDGGGPLACPSKNNPGVYVQAGIVAWGIGCGTETPGVYVNVPMFINWINNKLAAQSISID